MRSEITELREVIRKLVPLLAGKGLEVTQRGSQAYVETDPVTRKPKRVNIPNVSDNASDSFVRAVQGFIDHEVAHVLITDWNFYGGGPTPQELKDPKVQKLVNVHNIIEDTMIEREIVKIFPGSKKNIADLREHFIRKITKPAMAKARSPEEEFNYLLVPTMRALAGHPEFQEFMDDGDYWRHPMIEKLVGALNPQTLEDLKSAETTEQTLAISKELYDILYAKPPAPPPSASPPPSSSGEDGESQDKPEKKAGEGNGDGERDHSESDESESDTNTAGGSADKSDEGEEDDSDQSDGDTEETDGDKSEDAGDADSDGEEEGAGGDSDDADDDADDARGAGSDDPNGEDADDDGDEKSPGANGSDEGDGDEGSGDDTAGSSDEPGDEDETDADAGSKSGADDGDGTDDSDSGSDSDEGSGDEPGSGTSNPGLNGEDSDRDNGGASADPVNVKADGGVDEKEKADAPKNSDEESEGGSGVGSEEAKSMFEFEEDALEGRGIAEEMMVMISEEAVDAISHSDWSVFSREWDRIEPLEPPEKINSSWVPDMEDKVRAMTGRMQKDIERIMASQSHVVNQPGHKKGRLHAASLYRVSQGDPRVFTQKQEHKSKDTAVMLLVDNSGSMSGAKMQAAMLSSYALSATLNRVSIAHEMMGFTTGTWSLPDTMYKAMRDDYEKSGLHYDRTIPLVMPIYKSFDERLDATVKKRVAYAMNAQKGLNGNIDGECLMIAAERLAVRPEKRKVMIVLSDGQPAGGGNSGAHLKGTVEFLNKNGIETIGIGIMTSAVQKYYENNVVLNDVNDLPGQVMSEIKRLLA
ncbi:hypothetical protein PXK56_17865 [Phaeobacter gallaeciensis]|uniref:cobaltochelatase CobT-related protein n=1 Tax=Phaeobacter gallaeciensis TaxID=60890 RepID=UPI0023805C4F|nr:hypothetical protein [Phaeobacter gallaeciensis]MDE4297056.1 hypothetical protein [Phaeobacter gallaeciensis]